MGVRYVEMRKFPRLESNAHAKIIAISGSLRVTETIDCTILNISEGGALIVATNPIKEMEFYLELSNKDRKLYQCSVVRRESLYKVGVKFI